MNFGKLLIVAILMLVVSFFFVTSVSPVKACTELSAYTDYYNGKPTLIIYTGSAVPPNPNNTVLSYYGTSGWENVPAPSYDGVKTDAPQHYSGGWHYYFIATRWYIQVPHWDWNEDARWLVHEC